MVKGRFAPSPSGRMHLGNIYTALLSWLLAKKSGGKWILRIEDLDKERSKKEFADYIFSDLEWLGLEWDEKVVLQSERDAVYKNALETLRKQELLFECFCSRQDLFASSAPHTLCSFPIYSGKCRTISQKEKNQLLKIKPPCLRVKVPALDEQDAQSEFFDLHYGRQSANLARDCGDFIVRRSDGNFSYQLAVVADDSLSGVTQIVRGRDLLPSTHQQIFLYKKLGFSVPDFFHLPLLLSSDGRRLSKRDKDLGMDFLRVNYSKEELIGNILHLCGILPKQTALSLNEALSFFDEKKLTKTDIRPA